MTPALARLYATDILSAPQPNARSTQVDLSFDYDNMLPAFAAAIIARGDLGKERYGQHLMTFDGRDTATDLFQELLDALKYSKKWELEFPNSKFAKSLCHGLEHFLEQMLRRDLMASDEECLPTNKYEAYSDEEDLPF